jgi:hypothetical protein
MWEPPRHLWQFNQKSLGIVLKNAGLEVVKTGYDLSPIVVRVFTGICVLNARPAGSVNSLALKHALQPFGRDQYFLPRNMIWVYARFEDKSL